MTYNYTPKGTCSRNIELTINDDGIITDLVFQGGCSGNLQGVSTLAKGQKASEVADRLRGIDCNGKGTSCPDQLAKAIEEALAKQ